MGETPGGTRRLRLLGVAEVSRMLGVSRATVYRLVGSGDLPVVKIGDRTLFRPSDLEALIARSLRVPDASE
jgi:excisionase family DNA binding protein